MVRNGSSQLPDMSGSRTFENILSIRVLEWLVILIGSKIKGINKLEAREYKNSFVRLFVIIQEVNIKMLKLEHRFLFFRDILQ